MDIQRFPLWSSEEDARLRQMAASGCTKHEVSSALGRTVNAVAARAMATRVRFRSRRDGGGAAAAQRRKCLRCRNMFDAPSRFRFVCDLCHAVEESLGPDLG